MEKRWIDKISKSSEEELLRIIQRGGSLAIKAGEKVLERGGISGKHLRSILENIKANLLNEEEVTKIKAKAEEILIEKFLDEKGILTILDNGSPIGKRKATEKYRSENENISNSLLLKIIERVPRFQQWATKRLYQQNPSVDDLVEAIDCTEGELQREILQELFKRGLPIPIKDAAWFIEHYKNLAEMVWEKLHKEGRIKNLSIEQLYDIFRYTEVTRIKTAAKEELLPRLNKEIKMTVEAQEKNPGDTEIRFQLSDLEKMREKIKKENGKMELYTLQTT